VQDEAPGRSRQGTVTVLALLLSLLLGYAPAAAAGAEGDRSAVRHGKSDAAKAGALLRTGGRLDVDDQESDELLPADPPRPVASTFTQHPAAAPVASNRAAIRVRPAYSHRARAPPAA